MDKLQFYLCSKCGNLQVIGKGENPLNCCLEMPTKLEVKLLKENYIKIKEKDNKLIIYSNKINEEENFINCICFVNDNTFVIDYYFLYEKVNLEIPKEKGNAYIQINNELFKFKIEDI